MTCAGDRQSTGGRAAYENARRRALVPALILWLLGWAVTFIFAAMDTWQGLWPIPAKLLTDVTFDAFRADIWPITLAMWGVRDWLGYQTPLDRLLS